MPSDPGSRRRRLTLRFSMLLILLLAVALGGYGEARRQLAAKALVESLVATTSFDTSLAEVERLHAEKTAARWLAGEIRKYREVRRPSPASRVVPIQSFVLVQTLNALGDDAEPALMEIIRTAESDSCDTIVRLHLLACLCSFIDFDDRVFDLMIRLLETLPTTEDYNEMQGFLASSLAGSESHRSVILPMLIDLAETRKGVVQIRALYTLRELREDAKPAIPVLFRLLRSTDPEVRRLSVEILASIGPVFGEQVGEVLELEDDPDEFVRQAAQQARETLRRRMEDSVRVFSPIDPYAENLEGENRPK